jgi:VWFA-related protein
MRLGNLALILSASLLGSTSLSAQTAAQTAASPTPTQPLRVYSREVVVDVDVSDAKGNAVHGLTKDNFLILENNRPMFPRTFREHRVDEAPDSPASAAPPTLPPNNFSNIAPESFRPLEILLLDSLNTPVATQSSLRQRMVQFVEKLPAGTRIAVFGLSAAGRLSMIQGFTIDQDLLKKAIKSHKLDIGIPPLEDAGQEFVTQSTPTEGEQQNAQLAQAIQTTQPKIDPTLECNHAAARIQYTSNTFAMIARYVSGMPGRKNLVWYTGAFPGGMRDAHGTICYNAREDMDSADDLLEHSHVVVFPIDPRSMDSIAEQGVDSRIAHLQAAEHLEMETVAEQTGGKAFYNTNDYAGAANQAIDAGSNYYTITYIPTNQTFDTRLRNIAITVNQPSLTLLYKRGYHAYPPGATTTPGGRPITVATPLQSAMMRGTLEPSEILFHIATAQAPVPDTALPPGNTPGPKAMKPPYRHITLTYTIDIRGIQFEPTDDLVYHAQFEYLVNVYDAADGKLVNSSAMATKPNLPAAVYKSMLASGAKLRQDIDVPAKGDYVLRIGVHDLSNEHLGAIEIPTSSITP